MHLVTFRSNFTLFFDFKIVCKVYLHKSLLPDRALLPGRSSTEFLSDRLCVSFCVLCSGHLSLLGNLWIKARHMSCWLRSEQVTSPCVNQRLTLAEPNGLPIVQNIAIYIYITYCISFIRQNLSRGDLIYEYISCKQFFRTVSVFHKIF